MLHRLPGQNKYKNAKQSDNQMNAAHENENCDRIFTGCDLTSRIPVVLPET